MNLEHPLAARTGSRAARIVPVALMLSACGGGGGPAIQAEPQTITFAAAPTLALAGTATVSASASSGNAVTYSSYTPTVCSVDANTGVVTDIAAGTCTIAANQYGNTTFAPAAPATQSLVVFVDPAQTIGFGAAPALTFGGTATVSATATSGLPVSYSSLTPDICSVAAASGLVTDITVGTCTIGANQPGDATHDPAPQVTQSLTVPVPGGVTVPGAPTGVSVTTGSTPATVTVVIGSTDSGGSPITGYTVTSSPGGYTATGAASPVTVNCAASCAGQSFSVFASNIAGNGAPSTPVDIVTSYSVVATFYEPETQPNNSIFTGTFTFDATTGTVSNLAGNLTEAMTGGAATLSGGGAYGSVPMTLVPLAYQLSAASDGLGGVLVAAFALDTTNTFTTAYGGNGWSPGTGYSLYYGFPTAANPSAGGVGNAYAMIDVNLSDPTATLTAAQLDLLAYADCTAGGMMGPTCMTGTTVAGYGIIGSMGGYPVSETITRQ
jgi:hypothetical protein